MSIKLFTIAERVAWTHLCESIKKLYAEEKDTIESGEIQRDEELNLDAITLDEAGLLHAGVDRVLFLINSTYAEQPKVESNRTKSKP